MIGTIHHKPYGVSASLSYELKSTLATRRYACGLETPHYPVPALLVDSVSELSVRWSQWLDTMATDGIRI